MYNEISTIIIIISTPIIFPSIAARGRRSGEALTTLSPSELGKTMEDRTIGAD
jgi:hypothetical protein